MNSRLFALIALAGASAAPKVTRYRVDQTVDQAVDATAIGGAQQRQRFAVSTFVTVTLTDTAGGKVVNAVIDSMVSDSAPVPKAVLDSVRGLPVHGVLDPAGHISGVKPLRETSLAPQMTDIVARLYPGLRQKLKQGDGWTDTIQVSTPTNGGTMNLRRITTYKASAKERRGSTDALKVDASFNSTVNGTQQTANGPATIEGTGSGSGAHYVASDGRYLGGSMTVTTKLTLSGAFLSHVSLLSREFGRPSVSLGAREHARLVPPGEGGLLELADVVGAPGGAVRLEEGDIVVLDGESGLLTVPGGADAGARHAVRAAHRALLRAAATHDGASAAEALLPEGPGAAAALAYVLDALLLPGRPELPGALLLEGLLRDPALLLLDEPSEGLAPKLVNEVGDALVRLRESGLALLLVEQNLALATRVAQRVYVMNKGTIVFSGTTAELAAAGDVESRYLGV